MNISFLKSTRHNICIILLTMWSAMVMAEFDTDVPTGWAVVPSSVGRPPIDKLTEADLAKYPTTMVSGLGVTPTWDVGGVANTIGGGNGRMVEASGEEVKKYAFMDEPLVIMASGTVGNFQLKSHKTIVGVGEGLNVKGQIVVNGVKNVILRNINVTGGNDAMEIAWGSNHIWIDHCDVSACKDGLIDFKRAADKNTVSWVRFSKHHKTMLINNGPALPEDKNRLNITLHHLFWDGTNTRNPRAGWGQIHILNCYYNKNGGYGIHVYGNAEVTIEKNYFNNVKDAISNHGGGGTGYVYLIDNYTQGSGVKKKSATDPDRIFYVDKVYMYNMVLTEDVMKVPDVVQAGAGTGSQWGKIGAIPTPGQGCVTVSITPTLKWTKVGSEGPLPKTSKVYFGTTNPPPELTTVEGYRYKPGKLKDATVYYWKINEGKVWTFRTDASVTSIDSKRQPSVKNVVTKKPTSVLKVGIPGKSSHFIGVQGGKNQNSVYLMNGKEIIKGTKTPAKVKKVVVK